MACNVSRPLSSNTSLLDLLAQLELAILTTVDSVCGLSWTSVAYHSRRAKYGQSANESPTVLVYCRYGAKLDFDTLYARSAIVLNRSDTGIELEILPRLDVASRQGPHLAFAYGPVPETSSNRASIGTKGDK